MTLSSDELSKTFLVICSGKIGRRIRKSYGQVTTSDRQVAENQVVRSCRWNFEE